jgi:flagellin FlaB
MFEPILDEEERGQVGIGTLIVFIAMVLVAAIAAGVLINTAGFLQTQAETTGQESTEQVSNNLKVESVVSEVENDGTNEIRAIAIDVSLAPGSNPIDVTSATLEWLGDSNSATYAIASADPATVSDSDINVFADSTNFQTELTDESDTARIYLVQPVDSASAGNSVNALDLSLDGSNTGDDLGGVSGLPLTAGAEADVTITSPSGGQTTATVRVPDVLVDGEGVRL